MCIFVLIFPDWQTEKAQQQLFYLLFYTNSESENAWCLIRMWPGSAPPVWHMMFEHLSVRYFDFKLALLFSSFSATGSSNLIIWIYPDNSQPVKPLDCNDPDISLRSLRRPNRNRMESEQAIWPYLWETLFHMNEKDVNSASMLNI